MQQPKSNPLTERQSKSSAFVYVPARDSNARSTFDEGVVECEEAEEPSEDVDGGCSEVLVSAKRKSKKEEKVGCSG